MQIPVLDLLNQYGIKYIDKGNNVLVFCMNPAHKDMNPSLSIRKSDGLFKCWSCGFSGHYKYLYFLITGKKLDNSKYNETWNYKEQTKREEKIIPEIEIIGNLYSPLEDKKIREFLRNVGVYSDKFIEDYQITFSKYSEMLPKHLKDEEGIHYTKMVDRIISPIYNNGKLVNVEGRTYKKAEPKVLYVKGGSATVLYNWENIDKTKPVITTESIKNLWKIWNVNTNVVAMFRNIPSREQLNLLRTVDVIHFGDNDAGFFGLQTDQGLRQGTIQALEKGLGKDFRICWDTRKHLNGKGFDANDCSIEEINSHIEKAITYSEYLERSNKKESSLEWVTH